MQLIEVVFLLKIISDIQALSFILMMIVFIVFCFFMAKRVFRKNEPTDRGETRVEEVLRNLDSGRSIHHLILVHDGQSTEIDHVFIHPNGIFVIETKDFSGMIVGDENQDQWTQIKNNELSERHFQNPIKQNQGHIVALSKTLDPLGEFRFQGLVVFAGSGNIHNVKTNEKIVTTLSHLKSIIETLCVQRLTKKEIEAIYLFLSNLKRNGKVSQDMHVAQLTQRHKGSSDKH